jgi:hypothetical protein
MRISEVHRMMKEEGTLPSDKIGTVRGKGGDIVKHGYNKGVKAAWRSEKRHEARMRNELTLPGNRRQARLFKIGNAAHKAVEEVTGGGKRKGRRAVRSATSLQA